MLVTLSVVVVTALVTIVSVLDVVEAGVVVVEAVVVLVVVVGTVVDVVVCLCQLLLGGVALRSSSHGGLLLTVALVTGTWLQV